jgi:eukaryotic-like serine/threonine-protein kinase
VQTAIADPLIGRVLEGRYRIRTLLARGGMSTVYAGIDERLDRQVAVKVMSTSLSADPAFTDRFSREARSAAKLTHLNAVSVYDQGEDSSESTHLVFLVMELVSGRTLRDLLRERGRLAPAEAVSIMEPVLAALAAAHRAGLVHRDIKPENILLSDEGVVKVADFGLARAVDADGASSRAGLMMGTIAYCSPEQINRGRTDQRSDVYSAGVVMFELLTGGPPFVGESAVDVAYQHVHGRVPPPSTRVKGIEPALEALVLRATDNNPAGRPLDAGAFLAELADVRSDLGLPVVAVPPRPRKARPKVRRGEAADPPTHASNGHGALRADQSATVQLHTAGRFHDTIAVGDPRSDVALPPPIVIPPPRRPKKQRPKKQRTARSRRRRRGLIVLLVVLLLGAGAGAGGWWLYSGRFSRIPNVAGQSQGQAMNILRHAGFRVSDQVDQNFSETVAKNTIISTDPGSGSRTPRGREITLVLSKGQDRVLIPTVPADLNAALNLLRTLRIQIVQTTSTSDTVPNGEVIGTAPRDGSLVHPNSAVALVVSTGPPILSVPDETGQTQAAATLALQGQGFTVRVKQDFSDTVPIGSVISQEPSGDSQLAKFQTVAIDVSKGPQTVVIPTIALPTPLAQATAQLQALGLNVKSKYASHSGKHLDVAYGVDPPAGTAVDAGSTVTLLLI